MKFETLGNCQFQGVGRGYMGLWALLKGLYDLVHWHRLPLGFSLLLNTPVIHVENFASLTCGSFHPDFESIFIM